MAVKQFGTHDLNTETGRDYAAEIRKLAGGAQFPLTVNVDRDDNLIGASYETEWQEGSTKPVYEGKGSRRTVTDYKENYKSKKLTADQIKKIDQYLSDNIVEVNSGQPTQSN